MSWDGFPMLLGDAVPFRTVLEYLIYIAAIIMVTVLVTLWIVSTRVTLKTSDRESHSSHRRPSSSGWFGRWFGRGQGDEATGGKRRRRRSHRRRNPTLAETGGLPPIRKQDSASTEPSPH